MTKSVWPTESRVIADADLQALSEECLPEFNRILHQQAIDGDLKSQLTDVYLPLAAWIANKHQGRPLILGVNGAQGAGKSTLSQILHVLLAKHFNKSVVVLSIDDFYLSRQSRIELAKKVHPLLRTRGVPGTHDVALIEQTISNLAKGAFPVKTPVFDKATDDLLAIENWRTIGKSADIILLEGWCVGAQAQAQDDLDIAVNELESEEDPECIWREYVNGQLQKSYQLLFDKIDYLVMLKVPGMSSVWEWRSLQEAKLTQQGTRKDRASSQLMTTKQLNRFIMHFERLTKAMLLEMPNRADVVLELNTRHQIETIHLNL